MRTHKNLKIKLELFETLPKENYSRLHKKIGKENWDQKMIEWMTGAGGIWILMQGGSARIIWCSHNSCQPSRLLFFFFFYFVYFLFCIFLLDIILASHLVYFFSSFCTSRDVVPKSLTMSIVTLRIMNIVTLLRYWRIWRWKIGQMDANLATVRSTFGKSDSICQNLKVSNNFAEIFTLSEWYGSTPPSCSPAPLSPMELVKLGHHTISRWQLQTYQR